MMKLLPFYVFLFLCIQASAQYAPSRKVVVYGPDMNNINNEEIRQSVVNGVNNALWSCGFQPRLNPERDQSSNPYDISQIEQEVQEILLSLYKANEPLDAKDKKVLAKFKTNIDTDTIAFTIVNWISRNSSYKLVVLFYNVNTFSYVNQIAELTFRADEITEALMVENRLKAHLLSSFFCYDEPPVQEDTINIEELGEKYDLLILLHWKEPKDSDLLWEIKQIKEKRKHYIFFLDRRILFYENKYQTARFKYGPIRTDILKSIVKDYKDLYNLIDDKSARRDLYKYLKFYENELRKS